MNFQTPLPTLLPGALGRSLSADQLAGADWPLLFDDLSETAAATSTR